MTPAIAKIFSDAIAAAIPDTNLTVAQWADTYRYVSQGPEIGSKWKTSRVPFLKDILECATDVRVREIVIWSASRVGKTEGILNNLVGYFMHIDPCPIMVVQPTLDMAEKYSRDRLTSLIRETHVLRDLVEDPRTRDSGNTLLHKIFRGGHISIVGANSPVGLAAEDIRVLLLDEVDRFPVSAGSEGDPVALARVRTRNYAAMLDALVVMTSSPTIEGQSRIERAFNGSDQRHLYVRCPGCDAWQRPAWANVKWTEIELPAKEACYVCPECGVIVADEEKDEMIARYEWRAAAEFNGIAGFMLPGTVSPWLRWGEMAEEVTQAAREKSLTQKQVFVNTTLGELWKPWEEIEKEDVKFQQQEYAAEVPAGAALLTAGVDVQVDRVECEIVGWGIGSENWSIDYSVFYGDPSKVQLEGETTVWDTLEDHLLRDWRHELGGTIAVRGACIDSGGHYTDSVYTFARNARQLRRLWWAIKGAAIPGRSIAPKKPSRVGRQNVPLYTIGTESAKDRIASSLKLATGPGSCHFPAHYTDDYFDQLCSERAVTSYHKGYSVRRWEKIRPGGRNEAFDCRVYALAAKEIINPDLKRLHQRLVERAKQKPETDEGHGRDARPDSLREMEKPSPRARGRNERFRIPRRRGGFVKNW